MHIPPHKTVCTSHHTKLYAHPTTQTLVTWEAVTEWCTMHTIMTMHVYTPLTCNRTLALTTEIPQFQFTGHSATTKPKSLSGCSRILGARSVANRLHYSKHMYIVYMYIHLFLFPITLTPTHPWPEGSIVRGDECSLGRAKWKLTISCILVGYESPVQSINLDTQTQTSIDTFNFL